jgi:hypothetical protein
MHQVRRKAMIQEAVFMRKLFKNNFPKYHTKILLGDFNAKVGRENIFKPTIGNESLYQDSNYNGVRTVNFATSKNLVVKSTMFQHRNIHKYTWTSPDDNGVRTVNFATYKNLAVKSTMFQHRNIHKYTWTSPDG